MMALSMWMGIGMASFLESRSATMVILAMSILNIRSPLLSKPLFANSLNRVFEKSIIDFPRLRLKKVPFVGILN